MRSYFTSPFFVAVLIVCMGLGCAQSAFAYVGPGAGLSLAGAVWGLIAAVTAAVGFIVLWPMRRLFRRKSGTDPVAEPPASRETD